MQPQEFESPTLRTRSQRAIDWFEISATMYSRLKRAQILGLGGGNRRLFFRAMLKALRGRVYYALIFRAAVSGRPLFF